MERKSLLMIRSILQKEMDKLMRAKLAVFENKQTVLNDDDKQQLESITHKIAEIRNRIKELES